MPKPPDPAPDPALEWAAASSLARIDEAARRASPEIQELLQTFRGRVFDEGFKVEDLRRGKSHALAARFHWEVGETPAQLMTTCRLETARRLLISTDLAVNRVVERVGMSGRTFQRAFKRRFGQSPGAYRKAFPTAAGEPPEARREPARPASEDSREKRDIWVQIRGASYEEAVADWLVEAMVALEHNVALAELWRAGCDSPWVFELLCERSQQLGSENRQRGVELAELAVAWVETNSAFLQEATPRLRALGLARLGQARILAADLEMADHELRRAAEALRAVPWPERASVLAELLGYQGALRSRQCRPDEARDSLQQAIAQARAARSPELEIKLWSQLAGVFLYQGDLDQAHFPLQEAQRLVEASPSQDPLLRLGISLQNALVHALERDTEGAAVLLPGIKRLAEETGNRPARYQACWIEAMVHAQRDDFEAAKSCLQEARQGFIDIGDPDHAAIAALDLAILHESQGQPANVLLLASDALPVLEALHLPEAEEARDLLERAIADQAITRRLLAKVRGLLTSRALVP